MKRKKRKRGSKDLNPFTQLRKRRKLENVEKPFEPNSLLRRNDRYGRKRKISFADSWKWEKFYPNMENPGLCLNRWTLSSNEEKVSRHAILNIKPPVVRYSDEEYKFIDSMMNLQSTVVSHPQSNQAVKVVEKKDLPNQVGGNVVQTKVAVSAVNKMHPAVNKPNQRNEESGMAKVKVEGVHQNVQFSTVPAVHNPITKPVSVKPVVIQPLRPSVSIGSSTSSIFSRLPNKPQQIKVSKINNHISEVKSVVPSQVAQKQVVVKKEPTIESGSKQPQVSVKGMDEKKPPQIIQPPPPPPPPRPSILPPPPQQQQQQQQQEKKKKKKYSRKIEKSRTFAPPKFDPQVLHDPPEKWTREETDELFDLCEKYDLRFHIIQDRLSFFKPIESIKERYFTLCQVLFFIRSNGDLMKCIDHPYVKNSYNSAREKVRKNQVSQFYSRPSDMQNKQFELQDELSGTQGKLRRKQSVFRKQRKKLVASREKESEHILQISILERNNRLKKNHEDFLEKVKSLPGGIKANQNIVDQKKQELDAVLNSTKPLLSNDHDGRVRMLKIDSNDPRMKSIRTPVLYGFPRIRETSSSTIVPPPPPQHSRAILNRNIMGAKSKIIPLVRRPTPQKSQKVYEPIIIKHIKDSPSKKKSRKKKKKRVRRKMKKGTTTMRIPATKFDKSVINQVMGDVQTEQQQAKQPRSFSRSQLMRECLFGSPYTNVMEEFLERNKCDVESLNVYSSRVHEEFMKLKNNVEILSKKRAEKKKKRKKRRRK